MQKQNIALMAVNTYVCTYIIEQIPRLPTAKYPLFDKRLLFSHDLIPLQTQYDEIKMAELN